MVHDGPHGIPGRHPKGPLQGQCAPWVMAQWAICTPYSGNMGAERGPCRPLNMAFLCHSEVIRDPGDQESPNSTNLGPKWSKCPISGVRIPRSRSGQVRSGGVSSGTEPIRISYQLRPVWSAPPSLQAGEVMTCCTTIRQQDISDRQTPKPLATSSDRRFWGLGTLPIYLRTCSPPESGRIRPGEHCHSLRWNDGAPQHSDARTSVLSHRHSMPSRDQV